MALEKVIEVGKNFLDNILKNKKESQEPKPADKKIDPKEPQDPQDLKPVEKEPQDPITPVEPNEDEEDNLLERDDQELSDDEKVKKAELAKLRDEESADNKIARMKRKSEKRIGNLVGKLKTLDASSVNERKALTEKISKMEQEIASLKQPVVDKGYVDAEQARIAQYLEEDKNLPIEQRREMTAEAWEELNAENPLEAQRWVQRNESRRKEDRDNEKLQDHAKKQANIFLENQNKSVDRMLVKYPNTRPTVRASELIAEKKSQAEIHTILSEEIPEYRLSCEIVKENPKWTDEQENFGDLMVAELDKRMEALEKPKPKMYTEEELIQKLEEQKKMETDRVNRIDTPVRSTVGTVPLHKAPLNNKNEKLVALEKEYVKAGLDPALAAKRLEIRSKIPGIANYNPANDKD